MTEKSKESYFTAGNAKWTCGHKHKTSHGAIKCRANKLKEQQDDLMQIGYHVPEVIVIWEWSWDAKQEDWRAKAVTLSP